LLETTEQLVEFLKEYTIFKVLDDLVLGGISQLFEQVEASAGKILFSKGQEADAFYIVRQGLLEVTDSDDPREPPTTLGMGECVGEIALLHNTTRGATIRVAENSILLKLSKLSFHEVGSFYPQFTKELTTLVEKRSSSKLRVESRKLMGNLELFDLPTVIQTVVNSRQAGTLTLTNKGDMVAQIHLKNGKIVHVTYGHLAGEFGLYELLACNEPYDFVFEKQLLPNSMPASDPTLSNRDPSIMLIEGARRMDEVPALLDKLNSVDTIFVQNTSNPNWNKLQEEGISLCRNIWYLLEVQLDIKQLCEKLAYDRFEIYTALVKMQELEYIRSKAAPATAPSAAKNVEDPKAALIALNAVSYNLSTIFGRHEVSAVLESALQESMRNQNNLSILNINSDTATLDCDDELLSSKLTVQSLHYLARCFLAMAVEQF
jgi:CRP-like cAMP-binding protein